LYNYITTHGAKTYYGNILITAVVFTGLSGNSVFLIVAVFENLVLFLLRASSRILVLWEGFKFTPP
jgi:uncharacterized membrane protein